MKIKRPNQTEDYRELFFKEAMQAYWQHIRQRVAGHPPPLAPEEKQS